MHPSEAGLTLVLAEAVEMQLIWVCFSLVYLNMFWSAPGKLSRDPGHSGAVQGHFNVPQGHLNVPQGHAEDTKSTVSY